MPTSSFAVPRLPRILGWGLVAGVAVLAGIAAPRPLAAQSLDLGGGSGPIEVLADNGIEWQQDRQRFIARGNAVANRNDVTLRADELIAFYRQGGGTKAADGQGPDSANAGTNTPAGSTTGSQISRLEAHGKVRITSPTEEATGTDAVYEVAAGRMVLSGSPVRLTTPDQVLTAQDRLIYEVAAKTVVAEGGATIDQGARHLRADRLVAHLRKVGDRTEVSTVDALGGVVVTTETETARGSQGKYDAKTGIATLTGSVTITRDDNVLTGAKAVVNMKTGISTLYGGGQGGKARAVLVPDRAPNSGTQPQKAPPEDPRPGPGNGTPETRQN